MENFTDFTTIDYILTYPGMLLVILLMTQGIKKLVDIQWPNHSSELLAFGLSAALVCVKTLIQGDLSTPPLIGIAVLMGIINTFIIWFAATKSYDKLKGNDKQPAYVMVEKNATDEVFIEALKTAQAALEHYPDVRIKTIDKMPEYPTEEDA